MREIELHGLREWRDMIERLQCSRRTVICSKWSTLSNPYTNEMSPLESSAPTLSPLVWRRSPLPSSNQSNAD
ncbi:hypothetical protein SLA2020_055280 [Shorea laevis]